MSRRVCRCGHTEDLHIEKPPAPKKKRAAKRAAIIPVAVGNVEAKPDRCRVFLSDRLTHGTKGIYCPCEGFSERIPDKPVVKNASVNAPETALCEKCHELIGPRSSRSTSTTHRRCAA